MTKEKVTGKTGIAVANGVGLMVGLIFGGTLLYTNKKFDEAKTRHSDQNFPQLSIEKSLEDVQKTDGRVEKILTPKGHKYVLRSCDSKFNPKPKDIDGSYNLRDIEIICLYDLEGEKSYMGAMERAEEIYKEEINGKN